MINKLKNYIVDHYLVATYLVVAFIFILAVLFKKNLAFLIDMIACLTVIILYAAVGFLFYMIIRALFADHMIDKKSIKICSLLIVILALLIPVLNLLEVPNILELYLLAPLASWPAFLAIFILNINTKWSDRRARRKQQKMEQVNNGTAN